jgi:trehalose 6-phosphate synthase/phosphatase
MIRKATPEVSIGFFLHIPFPSHEIFRMMPRKWQEVLLDGALGADLVGFHTMDYASHFLECVQKAIGVENDRNIIRYKDRLISIGVFPISVDYASFNAAYNQPEVENIRSSLRQQWSNVKMIFSVDRLDYTKGVRNRLKAYNQFLQQYPEYKEKVVFIMTIVPSRDNIPRYVERKKLIDELISEINSQVATLHWQPIVYRYNSLSREELIALYTACDLALITPLRDGMNLVAKEFVASRKDQRGVLVISEMAGAAKELSAALLINPNDINETATAIYKGLTMHEEEQRQRMSALQHRIAQYDIQAWAEDFMQSMEKIKKRQQTFQELFVDDLSRKNILERFRSSHQRLLLLDYDGTLVPFSSRPELAKPDKNLLCLLQQLSSREDTDVYVVSGRNSEWLDHVFQSIPLHLVAEHGAMKRKHGEKWQSEAPISGEWKERIEQIMQLYVLRCPNTFVEQKKFSVVWHYRNADPVQGKWNAHALMCELNEYLGANFLQVVSGNKIVEVKSRGIDKGTAVKRILAAGHYDFVLAAGDDKTDEDMFNALAGNEHSITIKIGPKASFAQYNLMRPAMLLTLLDNLNRLPIRKFVH